jgi:hypothetical protein
MMAQATYPELLEELALLGRVLQQLQRFHDAISVDPTNPEAYGRKLLLGGAVHHLKNAVHLASEGRTLSAATLWRPGLECVELCWYLGRRGGDSWQKWVTEKNGRAIIPHAHIRAEMTRAAAAHGGRDDIAEGLRAIYRLSSAYSHPTRATLETLYARHEDGQFTFEPGLLPSRQTEDLVLRLFDIVSIALAFVGTLYKDPWPRDQAAALREHNAVLRQRWRSSGDPQ